MCATYAAATGSVAARNSFGEYDAANLPASINPMRVASSKASST
jgi:hypothetical protein